MTTRRKAAVWSLIGLATLITIVSSVTLWTKRQLLSTDQWVKSSNAVLANDQVRSALSNKVVVLLNQRVDITAQLDKLLPPQAKAAAPVVSTLIQSQAVRVVDAFLDTPQAQKLWENANRQGHKALLNVLEGKKIGPVSTANGAVVLDLRPLIQNVANQLGIQDRPKTQAAINAGEIVLLRPDQLKAAQDTVQVVRVLSVWLALLALGLYALAIYLAHGRRRSILQASGASLVLSGLLLLIVRRVAGNWVVDSLVKTDASKPPIRVIWLLETTVLRSIAIALIAYGLMAVVAGLLAGPSRAATWIRRTLAPSFHHHQLGVWAVAAVLFLLVIAWGPTAALREWGGILVFAVIVALGVEVWRRQIVREFPDHGNVLPVGDVA